MQGPRAHGNIAARGDDIDVISHQRAAFAGLDHRHRGVIGQKLGEQAAVGGIQMLNENEGHPGGAGAASSGISVRQIVAHRQRYRIE